METPAPTNEVWLNTGAEKSARNIRNGTTAVQDILALEHPDYSVFFFGLNSAPGKYFSQF